MNLKQYVEETARTAGPTRAMTSDETQLLCMALGLAGEAGEFADKVKKLLFHDHPVSMAEFTKELGDIAWYWTRALPALNALLEQNISHEAVLEQNVGKLRRRYPEGFTSEASLARIDLADPSCVGCGAEQCLEWCESDGASADESVECAA